MFVNGTTDVPMIYDAIYIFVTHFVNNSISLCKSVAIPAAQYPLFRHDLFSRYKNRAQFMQPCMNYQYIFLNIQQPIWRRKVSICILTNNDVSPSLCIWGISGYFCETMLDIPSNYNISRTLVGNKIVGHSDVVGASPVDAAPTTSSLSI